MVKINKVITKTGDKGYTGLFGPGRIRKDSIRMGAIGAVDELTALLGMIRSLDGIQVIPNAIKIIGRIQNDLFDLGSELAASGGMKSPCPIKNKHIIFLESSANRLNQKLSPLNSFILPGGSVLNAWLHLARASCREAERAAVKLAGESALNLFVQIYLNRLSDLLFILARAASYYQKVPEILWKPGSQD